jgi:hypothetical protein
MCGVVDAAPVCIPEPERRAGLVASATPVSFTEPGRAPAPVPPPTCSAVGREVVWVLSCSEAETMPAVAPVARAAGT